MKKLDFTDDAIDSAITGGGTAEKVLHQGFLSWKCQGNLIKSI